jgi:hypothetical protein
MNQQIVIIVFFLGGLSVIGSVIVGLISTAAPRKKRTSIQLRAAGFLAAGIVLIALGMFLLLGLPFFSS